MSRAGNLVCCGRILRPLLRQMNHELGCTTLHSVQAAVAQAGATTPLVNLINTGSPQAREHAVAVLKLLVSSSLNNTAAGAGDAVIRALVDVLKTGSVEGAHVILDCVLHVVGCWEGSHQPARSQFSLHSTHPYQTLDRCRRCSVRALWL